MSSSTDYTLQELLLIVEEGDSEKSPSFIAEESSPISRFIKEFNIRSGLDRIPLYVIYYAYREKFMGDLSKIEFFRQFKKVFTQRRTGKQRVYLLDKSSFDMSREGILNAEFHNKDKKKWLKRNLGEIK